LIVANSDQDVIKLQQLFAACKDRVEGLELLDASRTTELEPSIQCKASIYSPSTGIVDVNSLIGQLELDATSLNSSIIYNCSLIEVVKDNTPKSGRFRVVTDHGDIQCDSIINSAGLYAPQVASLTREYPPHLVPKMYFAKGNYFKISGKVKCFAMITEIYNVLYVILYAS
jgi:L-2-hydroxyglutarate oxidase LhgO